MSNSKPTIAEMLEAARQSKESQQESATQAEELQQRYDTCVDNAEMLSLRIWLIYCMILGLDQDGDPKSDFDLANINLDEADKLTEGLTRFFSDYGVNIREPIPGFEEKTESDDDRTMQVPAVQPSKPKKERKKRDFSNFMAKAKSGLSRLP